MRFMVLALYATNALSEPSDIYHRKSSADIQEINHIFCHGLGATGKQVNLYTAQSICYDYPSSPHWIIPESYITFNFPDAKNDTMEYHPEKVNLGQQLDIERLTEVSLQLYQENPGERFILMGVSRGAVTILNTMALNPMPNVVALVIESPFDTLKNVSSHLLKKFGMSWIPGSASLALKLANSKFPLLDLEGVMPINVVNQIPKDLPILLIHSRSDQVIPVSSSRRLYLALIESGHANTYYLEIAQGDHGKIILGPEAQLYQNITHAFYKKFNLPHNPQFAQAAEKLLPYCQPDAQTVRRLIKQNRNIDIQS